MLLGRCPEGTYKESCQQYQRRPIGYMIVPSDLKQILSSHAEYNKIKAKIGNLAIVKAEAIYLVDIVLELGFLYEEGS